MKKEFRSKKVQERVERIQKMESEFDSLQAAMSELKRAVHSYSELADSLHELSAYYDGDWKQDLSADENVELPSDLKRGVLSEDGLWNFFDDNRELADEMRRLCDEITL